MGAVLRIIIPSKIEIIWSGLPIFILLSHMHIFYCLACSKLEFSGPDRRSPQSQVEPRVTSQATKLEVFMSENCKPARFHVDDSNPTPKVGV